jgi:peptidoglycan/LPS O-acetylase OafA/YrhL
MIKASTTSEIRPLTSLRAIAAGVVLFFHYYYHHYGDAMPEWLRPIGHQGYFAVDIFFVLSGFVLTVRYADEIRSGAFRWGDYLRRRVARIWPLYYSVLAVWVLMVSPANLSNLTFTQGFFFELWWTGNSAAWSLTIEESFYLLMPLVLMTVVVRHSRVRLLMWSLLMFVIGITLVIVADGTGLNRNFYGFMYNLRFMADRTIFGYIPEFALGIGFGLWYLKHGAPGQRQTWLLIVVGTLGIIGTLSYTTLWDGVNIQPFGWIIGIFAALLILGLCNPQTTIARVMSHPLPVYLGRISFALYLLHAGPLLSFFRFLPSPLFYVAGNIWAAVFHELIEKPGHKLIINLGRRPTKIATTQPIKNS